MLKTDHSVGSCIPLGLLSEVINVGDSVVAVGYPGGNINEMVGHYPSHISRLSGKYKIEIPNAIKGRGQSGGPIYHYKSRRIVGIAQAGYDPDKISDTGLAIRLDLLFQRWSELRYINDELMEVWDERLHKLKTRFGGKQADNKPRVSSRSQRPVGNAVGDALRPATQSVAEGIPNQEVGNEKHKLPLIIVFFIVIGIGYYFIGIDNHNEPIQTKPPVKYSGQIQPIKEPIPVVPVSEPIKEEVTTNELKPGQEFQDKLKDGGLNLGKQAHVNFEMDVVFVMDLTSGMEPYLKMFFESIQYFTKNNSKNIKFGFIGYRDNPDIVVGMEFASKNFTEDGLVSIEKFVKLSNKIKVASVGSLDYQEEVFAGIESGLEVNWNSNSIRIIILIGDASSHEPGHPQNVTGKDGFVLRQAADDLQVHILAIFLQNQDTHPEVIGDLPVARQQFATLARVTGSDKTALLEVNADNKEDFVNALKTSFNMLTDFTKDLQD
ncbi:hypothetical protein QUF74_16810 [Candidatus Halobeggiatoa sp. HSG11]|nr:hypothetical protein [Candidatus Halobeggiatoa sp. HSG11]